jgi:predicted XRE-type DNA-binding protein
MRSRRSEQNTRGIELAANVQIDWRAEMKTADRRLSDKRKVRGSCNVFADLGFDEAEAQVMAMRAELMIRIGEQLKTKGWTQAEAALRLRVTQPRISKLSKGVWQDFSVDMLLTLAARAGLHTELRVG